MAAKSFQLGAKRISSIVPWCQCKTKWLDEFIKITPESLDDYGRLRLRQHARSEQCRCKSPYVYQVKLSDVPDAKWNSGRRNYFDEVKARKEWGGCEQDKNDYKHSISRVHRTVDQRLYLWECQRIYQDLQNSSVQILPHSIIHAEPRRHVCLSSHQTCLRSRGLLDPHSRLQRASFWGNWTIQSCSRADVEPRFGLLGQSQWFLILAGHCKTQSVLES